MNLAIDVCLWLTLFFLLVSLLSLSFTLYYLSDRYQRRLARKYGSWRR